MHAAVDALLKQLEAEEPKDDDSALQLGLLLESRARSSSAAFATTESNDPPTSSAGLLSLEDLREIVDRTVALLRRCDDAVRPSLFWVLSKAPSDLAFGPLVQSVHAPSSELGAEASCQAVFALDDHIFRDHDGSLLAAHADTLRACNTIEFLKVMNTPSIARRINTVQRDIERIRRATSI